MRLGPKTVPSLKLWLIDLHIELDQLYENYYEWTASGDLTEFEIYVLFLEDRRFFNHSGIDVIAVLREIWRLVSFRRFGGASTIDMQFVRTVNNRKELSLRRKMREWLVALIANYHFNKVAMLRSYLAIAYFGTCLTGAEEASADRFSKSTAELIGYEAAYLASMLVYPKPRNENARWHAKVDGRARYALRHSATFKERLEKICIA